MKRNSLYLFVLVALHILFASALPQMYRQRFGYGYGQYPQQQEQYPPQQTGKEYLDNKSNYTTFGIVVILFIIVLIIVMVYYSLLICPLLVKDRRSRKNAFTDISSTATVNTSRRSIPSMKDFPEDDKQFNEKAYPNPNIDYPDNRAASSKPNIDVRYMDV